MSVAMDLGALQQAKERAAKLKQDIAKLSPLEKAMGAKYLKPVLDLVESVEAL